jgi:hypothetical protein
MMMGVTRVKVRRLAALDLYGRSGRQLRRRLVVGEFVAGTVVGLALGLWILIGDTNPAGRLVGAWATGIGLNYLPLALHAVSLLRPGALRAELAAVDLDRELRRYSVLQAWVLVPLVFLVLAVQQRRSRPAI